MFLFIKERFFKIQNIGLCHKQTNGLIYGDNVLSYSGIAIGVNIITL